MNRAIMQLFLLAAFISLWTPASNRTSDLQDRKEISYPLSNNPEESTAVILQGKSLLIRDLPKSEKFNYAILKLAGSQDTLPVKKCKNARKEAYDVKFNLKDVPKGSYYIEIYTASKKYTTYSSYIHGQALQIKINDSSIDFIQPYTLSKNRKNFTANRQDRTTLDYYLKSSEKVQSDNPIIIKNAKSITAGASTDYDKVKAVHDWVSSNIWYDYDELYKNSPSDKSSVETLNSRKGVCIDYASLTAALLRAVGVPTKLTAGYILDVSSKERWTEELITSNKSNHVWNEAYVDGRWIIMDTTFDSNNKYKNKSFSTGTGMKNRKYFDITIEFFSTDRYIIPNEYNPVKNW